MLMSQMHTVAYFFLVSIVIFGEPDKSFEGVFLGESLIGNNSQENVKWAVWEMSVKQQKAGQIDLNKKQMIDWQMTSVRSIQLY